MKKTKKSKVPDLKPKKDAKGGGGGQWSGSPHASSGRPTTTASGVTRHGPPNHQY
jgi:hypothetical protein